MNFSAEAVVLSEEKVLVVMVFLIEGTRGAGFAGPLGAPP
jgi:hypothetical protein